MNSLLVKLVVDEVVFARLKFEVISGGEGKPMTGFATDGAIARNRARRVNGCLEPYSATVAASFVSFCHIVNRVRI